jgi:hypothetical protein
MKVSPHNASVIQSTADWTRFKDIIATLISPVLISSPSSWTPKRLSSKNTQIREITHPFWEGWYQTYVSVTSIYISNTIKTKKEKEKKEMLKRKTSVKQVHCHFRVGYPL